ncbi:MAG: MFS transporter [Solirubrobacteraceae bacterium]
MIGAYALVCAGTQVLWLTYAAIDTSAARHYGVSVSAVGWLSEISPLFYVVLAIPAGRLLDRWFRPALASGGALMALGALIRLGGDSFAWAMAGQVVAAAAQPVVLSAMSKLAGDYLPVDQRPAGIAIGSAGSFVGILLALILGPTIGAHGHIERLLVVEATLVVLAAVALAAALRRPGYNGEESAAIRRGAARWLWAAPAIRTLCGLVFVGFGVFAALATWLQALLHPSGVSEQGAGALLVVMIVAGIIGCAALPQLLTRRAAERSFLRTAALAGALGCGALGAVPLLGVRAAAIAVMGFLLLPALPVVLITAERLAGTAAGTAGAIIWMAGNFGALIVALIVQALIHDPPAAFGALAAVSLLALPLAARFPSLDRAFTQDLGESLTGSPQSTTLL